MCTVYPTFHHAAHHPLSNTTQPYDTYPPMPDINFMTQDTTVVDPYGTLPHESWGQWWSPEGAVLAESSDMAGSRIYTQESQYNNNYTCEPDTSEQLFSPAPSTHSYPIPSPITETTSLHTTTGDSESRRGSSSAQSDKRKCKRNTNQSTTTKATRRGSTTKTIKWETPPDKPRTRGRRAKPVPQPQDSPSPDPDNLPDYN
ncbi:hypothetical protein FSARC_14723, partial [Fusarium sarcochroum]